MLVHIAFVVIIIQMIRRQTSGCLCELLRSYRRHT